MTLMGHRGQGGVPGDALHGSEEHLGHVRVGVGDVLAESERNIVPGAPFSSAEGCIVPVDCVRVKSAQRGSLEKILLLGKITQPTDWTRARGTI